MMGYLILPSHAAAEQRSRAAYAASLAQPSNEAVTTTLWEVREHPDDGRAVLVIPEAPEDAALGLSQAGYDALLSDTERQALVTLLPADWHAVAASVGG